METKEINGRVFLCFKKCVIAFDEIAWIKLVPFNDNYIHIHLKSSEKVQVTDEYREALRRLFDYKQ